MGADFWFWKNHIFMFYFFLKVDPTILSSKKTNFDKNSYYY